MSNIYPDDLYGGSGGDTYVFNLGDGHDVIQEGTENRSDRRDIIRFGEGISPNDIELTATNFGGNYMDLVIKIKSSGETITVKNGLSNVFTSARNAHSIQAIEFADGTVWNTPTL